MTNKEIISDLKLIQMYCKDRNTVKNIQILIDKIPVEFANEGRVYTKEGNLLVEFKDIKIKSV